MNLTQEISLKYLTRQDKLRVWLYANRVTYSDLAELMALSVTGVRKICLSETATPKRVEQMLGLGLPKQLLPKPVKRKPGP